MIPQFPMIHWMLIEITLKYFHNFYEQIVQNTIKLYNICGKIEIQ